MDNTDFEGYTGIYLNNITFSNDILLIVVIILLSAFALIFRFNVPLFGKMISNINAGKQRQSIFDTTEKDSFLFNAFMTFQTLLLCSIFLFSVATEYKYFTNPDIPKTFIITIILLIILFLFYLFKKATYSVFGHIFAEKSAYKMMFVNYQGLFCTWGIFLYLPVLWILLIGKYLFIAYILFIISYLVFRIILIYRFIHIFFNKNTGLLFFSLYLCTQEIIPLVFLYEGLIYMYNIIEKNNIWQ
jgi:hypothetical protein